VVNLLAVPQGEEYTQDFSIFMPIDVERSISKSNESGDEKGWYVCGYASTPDLDLQGDIVNPAGIDISYFREYGWINYEHKQDAEYMIGVPTKNCYVDIQKGLYVEAKLLKNNQYAQQMWNLAVAIKSTGVSRSLGFSIEGAVKSRNAHDNKVIEELFIRNVTLTTHPANPHATWEIFMKSWETGHDINPDTVSNAGALRKEELAQAITTLSAIYKVSSMEEVDAVFKEIGELLDSSGRSDIATGTLMLQLGRGLSKQEAQKFVNQPKEES
jgi:hypothetical protein